MQKGSCDAVLYIDCFFSNTRQNKKGTYQFKKLEEFKLCHG